MSTKHTKDTPNGSVTIIFETAKPKKGDPIAITGQRVYTLLPAGRLEDKERMQAGVCGVTDLRWTLQRSGSASGDRCQRAKYVNPAWFPLQVLRSR